MANNTGKKFGGRKLGTPNKQNKEIKQWLQELIDNNRQTIEDDLKNLESKDRIVIIEKLMSYVVPKQKAIEAKINYDSLSEDHLNMIIDELSKNIEA